MKHRTEEKIWALVVLVGIFSLAVSSFIWQSAKNPPPDKEPECNGSVCL